MNSTTEKMRMSLTHTEVMKVIEHPEEDVLLTKHVRDMMTFALTCAIRTGKEPALVIEGQAFSSANISRLLMLVSGKK